MFFAPSSAVLRAILRDEYLTSAVRTNQGDKAGSNQSPARELVHFKLELTPNQWNSHLKNTSIRSIRDVPIPSPNLSLNSQNFTERGDPENRNKAVSTWSVQNSRPKAFEVCTSIQIHQSAYRDRWQFRTTTLPRYADWWILIDAHTSNVFGREFCTDHIEKALLWFLKFR